MSFFDRTLKYSSKKGHIKYNTKKMTENLFDPQNIRKMIIFFNKEMINIFWAKGRWNYGRPWDIQFKKLDQSLSL